MKKTALLLFFWVATYANAWSNHILGGNMTFRCTAGGKTIFRVELYIDCTASTTLQTNIPISIHGSTLPTINGVPSNSFLPINLISMEDKSPSCNAEGPILSCNSTFPQQGSWKLCVFETDSILLTGDIPPNGWTFCYTVNFRTANITNLVNVGAYPIV